MSDIERIIARQGTHSVAIHDLIYAVAREINAPVIASLKWGQPSFSTPKGTPIRIGLTQQGCALYAHCQSSVINDVAARFPALNIEGNRAVHFKSNEPLPIEPIRWLIHRALTYRDKRHSAP